MGCVLLAASSLATCSLVRFQPTAPRFWRSCSSLRAPMMTLATVGRCKSQFKAICGTLLLVSFATSSIASTTLCRYSFSTSRVASATSLAPQALKNALPPPNVPAPKLRTGTCRPEWPSCLNSMEDKMRQRKAQVHDGNAKSVPGKAGEYERGPPEARTEVPYLTRTMTRVMSSLWGAPEAKASAALIILAMESFAGSPLQFEMASRRRWSPHSSRVGFMASLKPSV